MLKLVRGLLAIGALITIFLVGMVMFQDRLLYFPTRASIDDIPTGLSAWPSPEPAGFRGLLAEAGSESLPARGTAVVFHGNAGHAGHREYYVEALQPLGLRVILAEYPGYGPRDGNPGEQVLVDDAIDTIAMAASRFGPPLIVIGESLGAAVAAAATARHPREISGVLLITPWDRLENVASHHYPWLPVSGLLRDRYDTIGYLRDVSLPVRIVLAERDEIVPTRLGRRLHEALAQPHTLVSIPGAGHNDWILRVDRAWWRRTLEPLLPPSSTASDSSPAPAPAPPRN